ncbi:hypothetical protein J3F84DRAFT_385226 [Trichoderma pleuroticola]
MGVPANDYPPVPQVKSKTTAKSVRLLHANYASCKLQPNRYLKRGIASSCPAEGTNQPAGEEATYLPARLLLAPGTLSSRSYPWR